MSKSALLAAILLALSAAAAAQNARSITFQEALSLALEHNVTLRQAQNAEALSKIAVSEARSQFLPNLQLSTQGAKNFGRNFNQSLGQITSTTTNSLSLNLSSGVVLFDGFGNTAALEEAKLSGQASERDVKRARETTAFTVATNFLALIQQQEQLRVQRENLAAQVALEQQIQTYVDAGARTIADLYQQQASVASARFSLVEAERSTELAKVDLIQTLQLDPAGTYEFEAPAADIGAAAGASFQLTELLTRASAQRADLYAEQARVAAADQAVRVARANWWPTVSLSAAYGSAYTSASDFSLTDQLDQRRGGSVGVGISVPLYDRGSARYATRRAEILAMNARISLESLQNDVGTQVRRAHLDFTSAQQQLTSAEAQVRAADLALQAAQDRYSAGASTLVELTQSQATHFQAASALVAARYNLLFQRTLMDYYVGDFDPAKLPK
jgi:outer membrane protein